MAPQGIPGTCYREGLETAPLDIYEGHREGLRADPLGLGSYRGAWKGGRLVLQDALVRVSGWVGVWVGCVLDRQEGCGGINKHKY